MTAITVLEEVLAAYSIGLCVLPVTGDGTKRPDVPTWARFKGSRPTGEEMKAFGFSGRPGYGMVAGAVSGYRESWDFDELDTYHEFLALADASGHGELVRRIEAGYCDETPAGGRRWIVQYPKTVESRDITLARRPGREGEPKIKTLIELPTFAILAPSHGAVHPSGQPYVRLGGGFDTIATYTEDERAELIALAQSFDVMPQLAAARRAVATMAADGRPGDDFNREATWSGILEPAGWCSVCTRGDVSYWRRPDKTHGISATTNVGGSDLLYVFTSSTSFEPERAYTKFAAYATLEHAGNFSAAARALSERGYGTTAATTNAGKPTTVPSNDSGRSSLHPVLVCLADVRPELVKWIWPGRLAAGKLTLIVGDPGLGKSFLTLDIAARVSAGRVMPGGSPALTAAAVILMSAEDGVADTIRPRLDALGADVNEIHHLAVLRTGEHERAVQLADTASLEHAIRETDARVLIIDPLSAYLGSTDSHRDSEVRSLLAPLAALADRTGVAILGVMHLAKNSQQPAIYRAVGSIAFAASARIVLAVAADPERDDRRIVASVKSNLSAPPAALAYTIANGCLAWESDSISDVDIDALLAGPRVDRQGHHEVDTWLGELLADGPLPVRQVQAAAREMEFGWRTVERAKRRLNVVAERIGGMADSGQWRWLLPSAKTDTHDAVSALASHRENSTKNSGLSPKTDTSNLLSVLSANVSTLESPPDRPEEDNDGVF